MLTLQVAGKTTARGVSKLTPSFIPSFIICNSCHFASEKGRVLRFCSANLIRVGGSGRVALVLLRNSLLVLRDDIYIFQLDTIGVLPRNIHRAGDGCPAAGGWYFFGLLLS